MQRLSAYLIEIATIEDHNGHKLYDSNRKQMKFCEFSEATKWIFSNYNTIQNVLNNHPHELDYQEKKQTLTNSELWYHA